MRSVAEKRRDKLNDYCKVSPYPPLRTTNMILKPEREHVLVEWVC